jgi:hypothetical protein
MSASAVQVTQPQAQDAGLTAALQLGWRIAELYAQVNDTGEPSNDTLLPSLERLVPYARKAPASHEQADAFKAEIRRCHLELSKDLWARDESAGKAYELGNGMSDTYSRISRAYREPAEDPSAAWAQVFEPGRIERLKRLLDDLQSRLNASGVTVVRHHLELWCDAVPARMASEDDPPPFEKVREGLRRQTLIWRQLITGDKQPEAYLDSRARGELHGELRQLVWKRCSAWLAPGAAAIFVLAFFLPQILDWYRQNLLHTGIASAVVAVGGALGITQASVLLTARTRVKQWSELLWNRALARKVSDATLVLDTVLPPPLAERRSVVNPAAALGRVAESIRPLRQPMRARRASS